MRAGIEQLGNSEFSPALQAAVNHLPCGLGDEMGADIVWELFGFQGASKKIIILRGCFKGFNSSVFVSLNFPQDHHAR